MAKKKYKGNMNEKNKKQGRLCCWCGKVEYTKHCQSKSLRRITNKVAKYIMKQLDKTL